MTNQQNIDQAKSDAFAEDMLGILNHAALALMMSIGQKTRLFDTMSRMAPSTSMQIASAAGLDERYVREWLAAMVTGRVIEYSPAQGTYHLPDDMQFGLHATPGSITWLSRRRTSSCLPRCRRRSSTASPEAVACLIHPSQTSSDSWRGEHGSGG